MSSFNKFLKYSRHIIDLLNKQKAEKKLNHYTKNFYFNFVLGNESADMDSQFGSLALAYFRYKENLLKQNQQDYVQQYFIPIMDCSRQQQSYRFEFLYLCELTDINTADIIYNDEVDLIYFSKNLPNFQLFLYDHNVLCTRYEQLSQYVTQIVDHHDDQTDKYDQDQIKYLDIQVPIGSATTILTHYFIKNAKHKWLQKDLATCFYATILLDSFNFVEKERNIRWTDQDVQAAAYLESNFIQNSNRNEFFEILESKKFDQKLNLNLGLTSLFRKDYKVSSYNNGNIGYGAILVPPKKLFSHFTMSVFEENIDKFRNQENLHGMCLIFLYQNETNHQQHCRELIFILDNQEILENISQSFKKAPYNFEQTNYEFQKLKPYTISFIDPSESFSRKRLEPIIKKISNDTVSALSVISFEMKQKLKKEE